MYECPICGSKKLRVLVSIVCDLHQDERMQCIDIIPSRDAVNSRSMMQCSDCALELPSVYFLDEISPGTCVSCRIDVEDDGEDGPRVAPSGMPGVIERILPEQGNCYSVVFANGVSGFFSRAEVAREIEIDLKAPAPPSTPAKSAHPDGRTLSSDQVPDLPPRHWAIVGCIPGDKEDTTITTITQTREEAIATFTREIWELDDGFDKESAEARREALENEHGTSAFINAILASDSPIDVI